MGVAMYDQSFSVPALERVLRKVDFRNHPFASAADFKDAVLSSAVHEARGLFPQGLSMRNLKAGKRDVYQITSIPQQLVIRKLTANIKRFVELRQWSRSSIITNLVRLLSEGIPYRVYRLDIARFYASFDQKDLIANLKQCSGLSPQSFNLLQRLFAAYASAGGKGIPTGLAISSVLADFMMREFDAQVMNYPCVYFYARYVDDILIITNTTSKTKKEFIDSLRTNLPKGLSFHGSKEAIVQVPKQAPLSPVAPPPALAHFTFVYLGYQFSVHDSPKGDRSRLVQVDIAPQKVAKIKTRISRAFLAFSRDHDFLKLQARIQFLTSNFSLRDLNSGRKKLAGIYESFPHLNGDPSEGLIALNRFLSASVLSNRGRIASCSAQFLTRVQKGLLMQNCFVRGHKMRIHRAYTPQRLAEIRECWKYGY
jgi:hypothetical protein